MTSDLWPLPRSTSWQMYLPSMKNSVNYTLKFRNYYQYYYTVQTYTRTRAQKFSFVNAYILCLRWWVKDCQRWEEHTFTLISSQDGVICTEWQRNDPLYVTPTPVRTFFMDLGPFISWLQRSDPYLLCCIFVMECGNKMPVEQKFYVLPPRDGWHL